MNTPTRPRPPMWDRIPRVLERTMLVVVVLSTLVQVYVNAFRQAGAGAFVSPVLIAGALLLIYRGTGRRWAPMGALILTALSPLSTVLLDGQPVGAWSVACFMALLLTLRGVSGLLTAVVIGAANVVTGWLDAGVLAPTQDVEASIAGFAAVVTAAIGSATHEHRRFSAELEGRARDALATREVAVERAVAEERLRVARDLHDSVGHSIAVVNMHLGAAQVKLPPGSAAVQEELERARAGVQEVLRETQQILRVLRVGAEDPGSAPPVGHERIGELVESLRSAGVAIEASVARVDHPLPATTSTAAFRIAQEALTNAQRHGAGSISFRLAEERGALVIEVVNLRRLPEDQAGTAGGGNGLVGMRERALSAGGRLEAREDGRLFRLRAELPTTNGGL